MREGLVPAVEAREIILRDAAPVRVEQIPIEECAGRVLAQDLAALRTQPPFAASAMDGYAVRGADVQTSPVQLKVIGQAAAGHPFSGTVSTGQAVRIFTGAPVPQGADTIIIQENTRAGDGAVEVLESAAQGRFVRPAGLDFTENDVLLKKGDLLDPQRLSLAASMNHSALPVYARPRVALLATGDELVPPGDRLGEGKIIASNTFGLAALVMDCGGEVLDFGIVADTKQALRKTFAAVAKAKPDLLLTTGGASVGDHDLVRPVLESMGARFAFNRIAMRPGKPMLAGVLRTGEQEIRLIGLAGNPVSSLVAGYIFVRPLVTALAGRPIAGARPLPAILGCDLPANDEREEYMRATANRLDDGTLEVTPFDRQDSAMLGALARADALVIRPVLAPAAAKGDACNAILLR